MYQGVFLWLFNLLVKPQGGNRVSSKVIDYITFVTEMLSAKNTTCFVCLLYVVVSGHIYCLQTESTVTVNKRRGEKINNRY